MLLAAGVLLLAALAWFMSQRVHSQAAAYASARGDRAQHGFGVWLYDNPFLTGSPKRLVRPCPRLHQPDNGQNQRPYHFSWRWLACLHAPEAGDYVLAVQAAEAVRLVIDGKTVIERWEGSPTRRLERLVHLEAGAHLIDLQNVQSPRRLELSLSWLRPSAGYFELIPSNMLSPLKEATPAELSGLYRQAGFWSQCLWFLPLVWLLLWWLVLRDPPHAWEQAKQHRWFLLIMFLAALLRLLWAGDVHGLSGESAHFMWRAELIWQGAWPFAGMNTRVGPLFEYLLAPFYGVFGPSVWLLRIGSALPNILAMVFAYRVCRREWDQASALAACLFIAVMPALVAFARMPIENSALSPLIFFLGLDLVSMSRKRPPLAVLAGLLWGVASFNHGMFTMLPFTLVIAGLAVSRLKIIKDLRLWGFGFGLALGYAPRLVSLWLGWVSDKMAFVDPQRLFDMGSYLAVFGRVLDGELVYKIFTGQHWWATPWLIPLAFALSILFLAWGLVRRHGSTWSESWLGLSLAMQLVMIPYGAPSANPRYYYYCVFFAALLMARAWGRAYLAAGRGGRVWLNAALALVAAFSLLSLGVNYFQAHLSTGGRPLVWKSGLMDHTSDAWMDHGDMTRELARRGYGMVAAGDYWHHTLDKALNLYQGRPRSFTAVDSRAASGAEDAAVFYNSPEGRLTMDEYLADNQDKGYRRVKLPRDLAGRYILLERTYPPVTYPRVLEDGS